MWVFPAGGVLTLSYSLAKATPSAVARRTPSDSLLLLPIPEQIICLCDGTWIMVAALEEVVFKVLDEPLVSATRKKSMMAVDQAVVLSRTSHNCSSVMSAQAIVSLAMITLSTSGCTAIDPPLSVTRHTRVVAYFPCMQFLELRFNASWSVWGKSLFLTLKLESS